MSVIEDVKQKTDIVEVIGQYTTLTKAGRTFRGLCPFHSEKRPSFFVYPEQQSWHCFGACSTGGDVFSFIMKKQSLDFGAALRLFAERAGGSIPSRSEPEGEKDEKERLYQLNGAAVQYFHNLLLNSPAGEKARKYLVGRGLSAKVISEFQLGFSLDNWEALKGYLLERGYAESELLEAGLILATETGKTHDRFRNRLMFPISDARGRVTGFGARVLDDSLPKYLNSPQTPLFDKSGTLYGINLAAPAIRQQGLAVIVEGYMDVIVAHQYGFSNVVASMGTAITEKQVNILKRLTRNMVLAMDADAAGEEAMLRCVGYENSLEAEVKVVVLPAGKDPDDVIKEGPQTWQQLLDRALPVVDYTFNMVTARLNLTTARDKVLAVDELLPVIAGIKDTVRQSHYLQKLAFLVKVSERNLEATLRKTRAGQGKLSSQGVKEAEHETVTHSLHPFLSSPLEEYCLALLLKHPELKKMSPALSPEYFENSENREIFLAWQQSDDLSLLKEKVDNILWEYVDKLIAREILTNQIDTRYADCAFNLKKRHLQNLEAIKAEAIALETERGGAGAGMAKLEEEGTGTSQQLKEMFTQKARKGGGKGDRR